MTPVRNESPLSHFLILSIAFICIYIIIIAPRTGVTPPPMLCRPYGADISGLTSFTGAYAPRLCCVAPMGLMITLLLTRGLTPPPMLCRPKGLQTLNLKPSLNLQEIADQVRDEDLFPSLSGRVREGLLLKDLIPDAYLEVGPGIQPGEDIDDAGVFARRLDLLIVVEQELG